MGEPLLLNPKRLERAKLASGGAPPSSAHVFSPATVHHPLLSARYPSHRASNPIAQPQFAGHSKRAPRHVPRVCFTPAPALSCAARSAT